MTTLLTINKPGRCIELHRDGDRYRVVVLACRMRPLLNAQEWRHTAKVLDDQQDLSADQALDALALALKPKRRRTRRAQEVEAQQ